MSKRSFVSHTSRTALLACKLILIITAFLSTASFAQEQTPVDISVEILTSPIRRIDDVSDIGLGIIVNMEENRQANGITVTVELPEGVTFVEGGYAGIPCTNVDNLVTCNFGSLARGSGRLIDYLQGISIRVKPNGVRGLTFTARITANEPDPNLSNNTFTKTIMVAKARRKVRFF